MTGLLVLVSVFDAQAVCLMWLEPASSPNKALDECMQTLTFAPKIRSGRAADVLPILVQQTSGRRFQHKLRSARGTGGTNTSTCYTNCSVAALPSTCWPALTTARPSERITDSNLSAGIRTIGGVHCGLVDLPRICQVPGLAHPRKINETIVTVAFVPDAC